MSTPHFDTIEEFLYYVYDAAAQFKADLERLSGTLDHRDRTPWGIYVEDLDLCLDDVILTSNTLLQKVEGPR